MSRHRSVRDGSVEREDALERVSSIAVHLEFCLETGEVWTVAKCGKNYPAPSVFFDPFPAAERPVL